MSERTRIPGPRDLTATLDAPDADSVVVACPPHPQMGGTRTDPRLRALGDALDEREIGCLRFDYGPWDHGDAEQDDARAALAFARDRFDAVGLFGYSFGAAIAILVAADTDPAPDALSILAPPAAVGDTGDTRSAFEGISSPVQVLYGERDSTVEWEPVVERARERECAVISYPADHFFVGKTGKIAERVAEFFDGSLGWTE